MYAALAANAGHPAVAALLGVGAAALAGAVVAMAWAVHSRQIRLAEQLARRQFLVMTEPAAPEQHGEGHGETAGRANGTGHAPGNGVPPPAGIDSMARRANSMLEVGSSSAWTEVPLKAISATLSRWRYCWRSIRIITPLAWPILPTPMLPLVSTRKMNRAPVRCFSRLSLRSRGLIMTLPDTLEMSGRSEPRVS